MTQPSGVTSFVDAMALASAGEEFREAFHRISVFSSKYDREDTDRKFDGFLQNSRSIRIILVAVKPRLIVINLQLAEIGQNLIHKII